MKEHVYEVAQHSGEYHGYVKIKAGVEPMFVNPNTLKIGDVEIQFDEVIIGKFSDTETEKATTNGWFVIEADDYVYWEEKLKLSEEELKFWENKTPFVIIEDRLVRGPKGISCEHWLVKSGLFSEEQFKKSVKGFEDENGECHYTE